MATLCLLAHFHALHANSEPHEGYMYRIIGIILGIILGPFVEHELPNVQVIIAAILPCRASMEPREIHDIAAQTVTDPPSCFPARRRQSGLYASLGCLHTQTRSTLGKQKNWTRRRISLASISSYLYL